MGEIRSAEFKSNRRKLLKQFHECQLCGNTGSLEVHHKIPLVFSNDDSMDNLIVICQRCHSMLHSGTHSILTKAGLKRAVYGDHDWRLSYIDLLKEVKDIDEPLEAIDILDIAEKLTTDQNGLTFTEYKGGK